VNTTQPTYRVLLTNDKGEYAIAPEAFGKAIDWYVIYNTETYEFATVARRVHYIDALAQAKRWNENSLTAPDAPIVLEGLLDNLSR
jgi:hypothetical protein